MSFLKFLKTNTKLVVDSTWPRIVKELLDCKNRLLQANEQVDVFV
jgi:hypothetical protein